MKEFIRKRLALPDPGFELDDPRLTEFRRNIILEKKFLKALYTEWYTIIKNKLKDLPEGKIVELGSGAGFIKEVIPQAITSDILPLSSTDMTFSALEMPFADGELSAIVMIDVLHHIPRVADFFTEAIRCLKPGGKIIMIEPAIGLWGKFIYKRFHHEPLEPEAGWEIPDTGPLSGANEALPWIIFVRDIARFRKEYPQLQLMGIRYHTPTRYLFSGGVSMRALVPSWFFHPMRWMELLLSPLGKHFSMFQTIEVKKI